MRGSRPLTNPDFLQGHRRQADLVHLREAPRRPVPTLPPDLLPGTATLWRKLWRSRVGQAWDPVSDLAAVTRCVALFDRWLRYDEMVRQVPMVKGSRDQLRPNPLSLRMDAIEGQLRALEEHLGLTPASRLRLGIRLVEGISLRAQLLARQRRTYDEALPDLEIYDLDALEDASPARPGGSPP